MVEQQKILRVFKLITLLAGGERKTIIELTSALEASPSTIYKYLSLLEEIGYCVEKDFQGRYFIFEGSTKPPFYEEHETALLQQCLSSLPNSNPSKTSLLKKIQLSSSLVPSAVELKQRMFGRVISKLNEAIKEKQWIRIYQYQSADSPEDRRDRVVFPMSINLDNGQLTAFDRQKEAVRVFKVHRMTSVETETQQTGRPDVGYYTSMDLFGFTGPESIHVCLRISARAKHLLEEEYPKSAYSISPTKDPSFPYQYKDEVRNFKGIGRFILGLPGEVTVESPVGLIEYLNMRVQQYSSLTGTQNLTAKEQKIK
ncbi:MAG TPA: WYL domain-containing transcriptional regulator [Cytophagaceae bacterium]|jgi:predicted DNA-binding transcriptional regulator YafY